MSLLEEIKKHEVFISHAYLDSCNVLKIGYGLNLDNGISKVLAEKILVWTIEDRQDVLSKIIPFWKKLSLARQEVFISMACFISIAEILNLRRMLCAAEKNNIESVCIEIRESKWYKQAGKRADEWIEKYRKG